MVQAFPFIWNQYIVLKTFWRCFGKNQKKLSRTCYAYESNMIYIIIDNQSCWCCRLLFMISGFVSAASWRLPPVLDVVLRCHRWSKSTGTHSQHASLFGVHRSRRGARRCNSTHACCCDGCQLRLLFFYFFLINFYVKPVISSAVSMTSVKHNVLEVSIFVNGKMKKINSVQRMHAGRSSVTKTGVAHFSLKFCQLYKTDHFVYVCLAIF